MADEKPLEQRIVLKGIEIQLVGMALSIATAIVMDKFDSHFLTNLDTFIKESVPNAEIVNNLLMRCALATEATGEWQIIPDERLKQNMEKLRGYGQARTSAPNTEGNPPNSPD